MSASSVEVTAPVAAPVIIPRKQHIWDMRIDYDETRSMIASRIVETRRQALAHANGEDIDPTASVRLKHCCRFLTELVNGSRSGEVFAAFDVWLSTGQREIEGVEVLKTSPVCICGHRRTSANTKEGSKVTGHIVLGKGIRGACRVEGCLCQNYTPDEGRRKLREIQIPEEVLDSDRDLINTWAKSVTGKGAYERFCLTKIKINTHSARYAFLVHGDAGCTSCGTPHLTTAQLAAITGQSQGIVERYLAHIKGSKYLKELAKAPTTKPPSEQPVKSENTAEVVTTA